MMRERDDTVVSWRPPLPRQTFTDALDGDKLLLGCEGDALDRVEAGLHQLLDVRRRDASTLHKGGDDVCESARVLPGDREAKWRVIKSPPHAHSTHTLHTHTHTQVSRITHQTSRVDSRGSPTHTHAKKTTQK